MHDPQTGPTDTGGKLALRWVVGSLGVTGYLDLASLGAKPSARRQKCNVSANFDFDFNLNTVVDASLRLPSLLIVFSPSPASTYPAAKTDCG